MRAIGSHDRAVLCGRGSAGTSGCGRRGTPKAFWTVALTGRKAYLTKLHFRRDGTSSAAIFRVGL